MYRDSWFGKAVVLCGLVAMLAMCLIACGAVVNSGNADAYDNPVFVPIYSIMPDGDFGFYHSHYHSSYYHSTTVYHVHTNTRIVRSRPRRVVQGTTRRVIVRSRRP